ncbi:hypothetical protein PF005_g5253 [Phytophthora fragariae]|uniref:Uncharacterized protein n=1 Tax=Phytophthora fragariae TaxID=53985 RepID=A0A6A3TNM9_9STRA|nr:hypothetical protein PF003_g35030 [Phytophthora fragariae]KAE8944631.1 hypothetical protein PF009_g5691 [Phytophthora fragariae]KAE9137711.1 hypothetical protein PF007_g1699 [Phytophthora fragariae]KAE9152243.1 hypothetical protein PF006_g3528 [Phytophthora fragariae]KAE9226138.1 hypothetical protein PF005_g5253 [Phytophthora fragariae]
MGGWSVVRLLASGAAWERGGMGAGRAAWGRAAWGRGGGCLTWPVSRGLSSSFEKKETESFGLCVGCLHRLAANSVCVVDAYWL